MENNNRNEARNPGTASPSPSPSLHHNASGPVGAAFAFSLEALAPCLEDLKRQLELRQAMH